MRDRYVRRLMVGLILVFPVLVARMTPGRSAAGPVVLVEAVVIAGLFGAYRARRGLLAAREAVIAAPRPSPAAAHFAPAAPASLRQARTR